MKTKMRDENYKIENNQFICLSCGYVEALQIPMGIGEWTKLLRRLAKEHKNCKRK